MTSIVFFISIFGQSQALWKLSWYDEFDGETLDSNNWEVDVGDFDKCDSKLFNLI